MFLNWIEYITFVNVLYLNVYLKYKLKIFWILSNLEKYKIIFLENNNCSLLNLFTQKITNKIKFALKNNFVLNLLTNLLLLILFCFKYIYFITFKN